MWKFLALLSAMFEALIAVFSRFATTLIRWPRGVFKNKR